MITAYLNQKQFKSHLIDKHNLSMLEQAVWIDVLSPTPEEKNMLEKQLGLSMPSREAMLEIELSSRLYKHKTALFMTANMLAQAESPNPKHEAVSFVLTQDKLITIRYIEPSAFNLFIAQLNQSEFVEDSSRLLLMLLEDAIDRFADILENIARHLESLSNLLFSSEPIKTREKKADYYQVILQIGHCANLNANAKDCLVSFNRLVAFLTQSINAQLDALDQTRLITLSKDITSLSDHATFISSKVNFFLDATLGMINIEQNTIIKIFSVAAVIFLPPTLIASIYGMNFKWMPALDSSLGYWVIMVMMILSALLPYIYFKIKKWL